METFIIKKQSILSITIALLLLFSCEEFVTEQPLDVLTVDQSYNTDDQLTQAAAGIYRHLGDDLFRRGFYQMFLENRTDAMMLGLQARNSAPNLEIATFNYTPANSRIEDIWETMYNGINNANVLIEEAPGATSASEETVARVMGEAYFFRAFFYFHLVRMFGEVPLITVSAKTFEDARRPGRAPIDEIYAQIIEDAQTAAGEILDIVELPAQHDNQGRIAISAAHTLLADVYLTREEYQLSADYSRMVMDAGQHALWDNYADAFDTDLQYQANTAANAENVFDAKFHPDVDPGSRFANFAWPNGLITPYAANPRQRGQGIFEVDESVYNRIDDSDTRKAYVFPNTYPLGSGAESIAVAEQDTIVEGVYAGLVINAQNPYFPLKYPMDDPRIRFRWGTNPWPIYRYADVLLMNLEALNALGTATQGDLDQTINRTRARGGLPPLMMGAGPALLDAIKEERFIEFFYEGKRFFDLVRWGELVEAVNSRDFDYGLVITINEDYELLPIPQVEIDANPNITENNPPW